MTEKTHQIIEATYKKIQSLQNDDGSFTAIDLLNNNRTISIFPSIYLGHILSKLHKTKNRTILNKICLFIKNESSKNRTWNYWGSQNIHNSIYTYPDDLDDTALAIATMARTNCMTNNEQHYIDILQIYLSTLNMVDMGYKGPFNTWILEKGLITNDLYDIDIVVQSHILWCANTLGVHMPGIIGFIDTCILYDFIESKYYDNRISALYAIISSYRGSHRNILKSFTNKCITESISNINNTGINILNIARLITSAIKIGIDYVVIKNLYNLLLSNQNIWTDPCPLYTECKNTKGTQFIGCSAITLASVIEAIELYDKSDHDSSNKTIHE